LIGDTLALDVGEMTLESHENEARVIDEKRITAKCEIWDILREGDNLETESLEILKSCVLTVGISVEFVIRFAIIHENIIVVIKLDIPTSLTVGISGKLVPIPCSTLIRRGNNSDIFGRVYKIPIKSKKSELCVVIVPTEVVPDSIAVIVFIDI